MSQLLIQKQTQAEKDEYLFECFHDTGAFSDLIQGNYSILAGRKGSGKTALARYIENKFLSYNLLGCLRVSINSFSTVSEKKDKSETREKILQFILLKTAKYLFEKDLISKSSITYWDDVFKKIGINKISDYQSFKVTDKTSKIGFMAGLLKGSVEERQDKSIPEIDASILFHALIDTLDEGIPYLIFIDDISDYLDSSNKEHVNDDLEIIKEVLFMLDEYNTQLSDNKKKLRFISCVRDDLFEFLQGSNINKLRSSSYFLSWNEKSFASLLIRRMPFFKDELESALANPVESIRSKFPDEIFQSRLSQFDTNRYATNFYAYLVAISFNRPRDFLSFCYAMRNRLSDTRPAVIENIDSAEVEYTDYFISEIRDELYLASQVFNFESNDEALYKLVDILARKDAFNSSQLRTDVASILEVKTNIGRRKIENFIYELWMYGILGYQEKGNTLIHFKYMSSFSRLIIENLDTYKYFLHRGLWWFAQKRRKEKSERE